MGDSPSILSHARGRGGEASDASHKVFHCQASLNGMAELGFLVSLIMSPSWYFRPHFTHSESQIVPLD